MGVWFSRFFKVFEEFSRLVGIRVVGVWFSRFFKVFEEFSRLVGIRVVGVWFSRFFLRFWRNFRGWWVLGLWGSGVRGFF